MKTSSKLLFWRYMRLECEVLNAFFWLSIHSLGIFKNVIYELLPVLTDGMENQKNIFGCRELWTLYLLFRFPLLSFGIWWRLLERNRQSTTAWHCSSYYYSHTPNVTPLLPSVTRRQDFQVTLNEIIEQTLNLEDKFWFSSAISCPS